MADQVLPQRSSWRARLPLAGAILGTLLLVSAAVFAFQAFSRQVTKTPLAAAPPHYGRPQTWQSDTTTLAVISNSGSTNLPGVTLTINLDGSGSLHYEQGRNRPKHNADQSFPVGTFNVKELTALLNQVSDMSKVPNHSCLKSISFGSTTTVTYHGKTSGDISCLTSADGQTYSQLRQIIQDVYKKYAHTFL